MINAPKTPGRTRLILEMGSGNDLHGADYTKAALRAVQDALHHSSLSFIRSMKIDRSQIDVEVTIGVQKPAEVDVARVKASLPASSRTSRQSRPEPTPSAPPLTCGRWA